MKTIPLSQGKVAFVDDADFDYLSQFKWTYHREHKSEYAIRCETRIGPGPRQVFIKMHREILGAAKGVKVDHRDGDGLNNQRENLRTATTAQNGGNRRKYKGKSRFKGVQPPRTPKNGWRATIWHEGRLVSLGTYKTEEVAARAYDEFAKMKWGEYANLNFP